MSEELPRPQPAPGFTHVRLPLARPVLTTVLLALLVVVFLLETVAGGSQSNQTLLGLGAQLNILVAAGQYWRLLASMFLHIGLMHLAFNGWALFSLGREVESIYGSLRFAVIYLLSGLFGSLATYVLGANVISAGASGAIFGLIGAEVAFFLTNRRLLGRLSREQLMNLAVLVALNLVFGFTVAGINNLAHIGGLVSGFGLGLGLVPRYEVKWDSLAPGPRLADRNSLFVRLGALVLAVAIFAAGIQAGNQRWEPLLRQFRTQPRTEAPTVPSSMPATLPVVLLH